MTPGEKVFNAGVLNICLSSTIEELVIHEFTHKLDVDALKGSGKKIPKVRDYNNSDVEFNAWSNALIRRLERFYIYNKDNNYFLVFAISHNSYYIRKKSYKNVDKVHIQYKRTIKN